MVVREVLNIFTDFLKVRETFKIRKGGMFMFIYKGRRGVLTIVFNEGGKICKCVIWAEMK